MGESKVNNNIERKGSICTMLFPQVEVSDSMEVISRVEQAVFLRLVVCLR